MKRRRYRRIDGHFESFSSSWMAAAEGYVCAQISEENPASKPVCFLGGTGSRFAPSIFFPQQNSENVVSLNFPPETAPFYCIGVSRYSSEKSILRKQRNFTAKQHHRQSLHDPARASTFHKEKKTGTTSCFPRPPCVHVERSDFNSRHDPPRVADIKQILNTHLHIPTRSCR